jgi:hypothetical protein
VFVLIAVGLFFLYISPTYNNQIVGARNQIQSYDSALAAAAVFTQKENQLQAEQNAIAPSNISRLNEYLPDGVDNIQLILDMDALAARSGVTLSDFSIQNNATSTTDSSGNPLQSTSLTDSLDLSVSATATYSAFQTFLAAAEQSLRPLDIMKLTLKSSGTGVYTYDIDFRIYWLQ